MRPALERPTFPSVAGYPVHPAFRLRLCWTGSEFSQRRFAPSGREHACCHDSGRRGVRPGQPPPGTRSLLPAPTPPLLSALPHAPSCGKGPGQPPDVCAGLGRWLRSRAPGSGCGGGCRRGARQPGAPPCAWGADPGGTEEARARGGLRGLLGTVSYPAAAPWAARRTQSKRNCCGT